MLGRGATAVALIGGLLAGACGGGDSPAAHPGDHPVTAARGGSESTELGPATVATCSAALVPMTQAAAGVSGGDPRTPVDEVDQLRAIAASAPAAIKADLAVVVDGISELTRALQAAGHDSAATPDAASAGLSEALAPVRDRFKDADYEAAAQRVSAWLANGCQPG
jgi:hypothetical protein